MKMIKRLFLRFGMWRCLKTNCHKMPQQITFDGVNLKGKCPRCNEMVLQDSIGEWFH